MESSSWAARATSPSLTMWFSGAKERRPELDRLLAGCRKRHFDAVVVYRYDRFARSLRQLVNALAEFDALGIQFVSLHEGVDTSTPNGRLVFGIFASIAEFETRVDSGARAFRFGGGACTRETARAPALQRRSIKDRRAPHSGFLVANDCQRTRRRSRDCASGCSAPFGKPRRDRARN